MLCDGRGRWSRVATTLWYIHGQVGCSLCRSLRWKQFIPTPGFPERCTLVWSWTASLKLAAARIMCNIQSYPNKHTLGGDLKGPHRQNSSIWYINTKPLCHTLFLVWHFVLQYKISRNCFRNYLGLDSLAHPERTILPLRHYIHVNLRILKIS